MQTLMLRIGFLGPKWELPTPAALGAAITENTYRR